MFSFAICAFLVYLVVWNSILFCFVLLGVFGILVGVLGFCLAYLIYVGWRGVIYLDIVLVRFRISVNLTFSSLNMCIYLFYVFRCPEQLNR